MFVIPKRNGGFRPVFNLRHLNQYVQCPHFKLESIQQVIRLIRKNDYFTSVDLTDAFLHILIHRQFRRYLRFHWEGTTFQFRTTPFGLSVVPWLFTRITKPILQWARQKGIRISAYLDDWILIANSKEQAQTQTTALLQTLNSLGWLINYQKSQLNPSQVLDHLGFQLDSQSMTIRLPGSKIRDLRRSIREVLKNSTTQTPRRIHSLTMRIKAATLAIFPANLHTQALMYFKNNVVKNVRDWDKTYPLPQACLTELRWWLSNLSQWNGRSLLPQTPEHCIFVDASDKGWGGVFQDRVVQGLWTADERVQSINWRELKAIELTLLAFPNLHDTSVLIRTDNTTAKAYINRQGGTRSLSLSQLATKIWNSCLQRNLQVQAQHIPGIANTQADLASRRFYLKNLWKLTPPTFAYLQRRWGPHDVDLFADRTTNLLPRYVSWKLDPQAIATDALSIPWTPFHNPYMNPPWNLIMPTLQKIKEERLRQVTLVVPHWPTAIWFPLLTSMAIESPVILDPKTQTMLSIPSAPCPWTNPNWKLSVWKLSGDDLKVKDTPPLQFIH
jgi:hypothetical protein